MSGKSFANSSSKEYKYIEVKYFDPTELVSYGGPELTEMMNQKLDIIKDRYESALVSLQNHNSKILDQIGLFRQLEKIGNVGISFDEMKCESVIEKLWHIEKDSKKIWDAFTEKYKPGFFYG
jgi:hypothetical protein